MTIENARKENNGLYQANRMLERIRSMFNKAIEWGWDGVNPTQGIKKFKEKSRDRYILPNEMPLLLKALYEEQNEVARDYIYISLFTGARKSNVLQMRWEEVDWHNKTWRIPDTKNGEPIGFDNSPSIILKQAPCSSSVREWRFVDSLSTIIFLRALIVF